MQNSLYPAFVRINYHSVFGPHTMTIPTLPWDPSGGTPASGEFDVWDGSPIEADVMINNLVDLLAPFFSADNIFDDYIIYTLENPEADADPRYSAALATLGTNGAPGWEKATQNTWSFRTTSFGAFKLVLLDSATADNFDRITDVTGITPAVNLIAEITDVANGWSGRDGTRPAQFSQIAVTLNEKLRRSYRMN